MTHHRASSASGLLLTGGRVERGDFAVEADLRVQPGEILALVGPNGSGKTSLIHALAGLVPLSAGRLVLGADAAVLDDPAQRRFVPPQERRVGLVHQQHLLFGHLSALENVAFGLRAQGVARRPARAQAQAWLERFELGERARLHANRLSGGQSQRVAIARAVCSQPRLLLFDEPFAALDTASRADLGALVRRLVTELAIPAVLVSHDEAEVTRLADSVVALEAGGVRAGS